MDVYRAFFHKNVITPDLIQQLGAGKYALGVCHEEMQQAELGRPDLQEWLLPDRRCVTGSSFRPPTSITSSVSWGARRRNTAL